MERRASAVQALIQNVSLVNTRGCPFCLPFVWLDRKEVTTGKRYSVGRRIEEEILLGKVSKAQRNY